MKVHEYQAKEIFSTYGIPVERHALCHTADGAVAAYHRMGVNRVAIKAQVLTGGRGKAGGVKLANNDRDACPQGVREGQFRCDGNTACG